MNFVKEKKESVSPAVISRLPRYYRYLRDLLSNDIYRISSSEFSKGMNVTASQIRQDLNCFGGFGQQGYGYNVKYLFGKVSEILGVLKNYKAVIIGAGNLGCALAQSRMFIKRGVYLTALFDNNPEIIGKRIDGLEVLSMEELSDYCKKEKIDIAVLALPGDSAEEVSVLLHDIGIKGIWNFTNRDLSAITDSTLIQNVHLGDSLMQLTYKMSESEEETTDGKGIIKKSL